MLHIEGVNVYNDEHANRLVLFFFSRAVIEMQHWFSAYLCVIRSLFCSLLLFHTLSLVRASNIWTCNVWFVSEFLLKWTQGIRAEGVILHFHSKSQTQYHHSIYSGNVKGSLFIFAVCLLCSTFVIRFFFSHHNTIHASTNECWLCHYLFFFSFVLFCPLLQTHACRKCDGAMRWFHFYRVASTRLKYKSQMDRIHIEPQHPDAIGCGLKKQTFDNFIQIELLCRC